MINKWWTGDDRERFWLEITNRTDLGTDLWAPQLDDGGREYWSYSLVNHVRPGDFVLHWSKQAGPAIVAYSHVSGTPQTSAVTWQSRGAYGRQRPSSGEEAGWLAPLSGFRMLRSPITLEGLRGLEDQIRQVHEDLAQLLIGPLYFPFVFSDRRPLRATQGYLTKFPYRLVAVISELSEMRDLARTEPGEPRQSRQSESNRQTLHGGRQTDTELRRAIERHAVEIVAELYRHEGYDVQDVGDRKSWDITAHRDAEEIHIEVKGSTGARDGVDLTEGEVRNAEDHQQTDLVVVDSINWTRTTDGFTCNGGRMRRWKSWVPDRSVLIPTSYCYPLPRLDDTD